MASILPQGTGTPYVALYDGANIPIVDAFTGMAITTFMTDFKFDMVEGQTKVAELTFKLPLKFALKASTIAPDAPIKVVMGWIYPDQKFTHGPAWDMMVTSREVSFTQHAIDFTLTLSDRTILYNNTPADYDLEGIKTSLDLIKKLLEGKEALFFDFVDYQSAYKEPTLGVVKTDAPITDEAQVQGLEVTSNMEDTLWNGSSTAFSSPEAAKHAAGEDHDVYKTVVYEYNPETAKLVADDPNHWEVVIVPDKKVYTNVIIGTLNTKKQQLEMLANYTMGNGPYSMNSNPDGSVEIRNQKLYEKPYKSYTYAGGTGELISFKIESDFQKSAISAITGTTLTPDKNVETVFINSQSKQVELKQLGDYFVVLASPVYTGDQKQKYNQTIQPDKTRVESAKGGYNDDTLESGSEPVADPELAKLVNDIGGAPLENQPPTYSSIEEAEAAIKNESVTPQEWLDYVKNFQQRIQDYQKNLTTEDNQQELYSRMHGMNNIPPYEVKRVVNIDGDFETYKYAPGGSGIDNPETFLQDSFAGYQYLKSVYGESNIKILDSSTQNMNSTADMPSGGMYTPTRVHINARIEITVPVPGFRVLNSNAASELDFHDKGDMVESINDSVKASANIIGDPNLREGMNVIINGVDPFSGIYYITKVSHRMTPSSGYMCQVEFQPRDITISQNTVKFGYNLQKIYENFNKETADIAKETERSNKEFYNTGVQPYYNSVVEDGQHANAAGYSSMATIVNGIPVYTYTKEVSTQMENKQVPSSNDISQ